MIFADLFAVNFAEKRCLLVSSWQDKFTSVWQVNSPNSQDKFHKIIMLYRHVFDMISSEFHIISCVFVNFVGFRKFT